MTAATRCAVPRWVLPALAVGGLLGGCAQGQAPAAPRAAVARPSASATAASHLTARARADDYPLGVAVFPAGKRRALPTLRGSTLDGSALALSQLRGKVVVLHVWASWCEPCRAELPDLARLATEPEAAGVRFVGLDENDTPGAAGAALRSVGSSYPHLVDRGALLARLSAWLPDAVPGCLVIDRQGRVAARVIGPVTAGQLRPVLAGLVAA